MTTPQQAIATCTAHSWIETTTYDNARRVYACSACPETTTGCQDCARPLETALTICARCLERARGLLDDIGAYLAEMSDIARVAVGLRAVRYDLAGTASSSSRDRLPHGLDAAYREDTPVPGPASIRTTGGALDLLEAWVDDWSERCGDDEGAWDTLAYLRSHTLWAAQNHPAWDVYLEELRTTRAVVRRLAGLAPERVAVPCVHCGGSVVREWDVAYGLADDARCTRCRRSWSSTAHMALDVIASWSGMSRIRPAALLAFGELAMALDGRVPKGTLKTWIHRGLLRPVLGPWPRAEKRARRRRDGTTERLYRFVDADLLAAWDDAHTEHELREAWDAAHAEDAARHAPEQLAEEPPDMA